MSTSAGSSQAYRPLIEQLVDDSSFFWVMRSQALNEPHYSREDMGELEHRMEASIQAMLTSPDDAWDCARDNMSFEEGGEAFIIAILAFSSGDVAKIKLATDYAAVNEETHKGTCCALAWLNTAEVLSWLQKFLLSDKLDHRYLAIRCYSALRKDPGAALTQMLVSGECREHELLTARCLRLVGELKRKDCLPLLEPFCTEERPALKFWALWSAVLLGDHAKVDQLLDFVEHSGPLSIRAMQLYCRTAGLEKSRSLISTLAKNEATLRLSILAAATLGDPKVVPWLIKLMEDKACARVAGEAFSQITGIDLEANNLSADDPVEDVQEDQDAEDEDVDLDEDEHLPWPDIAKVTAAWAHVQGQFEANCRYFLGTKVSATNFTEVIKDGSSRNRRAAALEAAVQDPNHPLVNIEKRVAYD